MARQFDAGVQKECLFAQGSVRYVTRLSRVGYKKELPIVTRGRARERVDVNGATVEVSTPALRGAPDGAVRQRLRRIREKYVDCCSK